MHCGILELKNIYIFSSFPLINRTRPYSYTEIRNSTQKTLNIKVVPSNSDAL